MNINKRDIQRRPKEESILQYHIMQLGGKKIYFTRVIVALALLGNKTSHSQNKLFISLVTQYTIIFSFLHEIQFHFKMDSENVLYFNF